MLSNSALCFSFFPFLSTLLFFSFVLRYKFFLLTVELRDASVDEAS